MSGSAATAVAIVVGVVAILAAVAVVLLVVLRRCRARARETVRIALAGEEPVLQDDMANFFGRRAAPRMQVRGNGCLALSDDELVFVQWIPARTLRIRREAITAVDTPRSHVGKTVGRPLLRVTYHDDAGGEDAAAWYLRDLDAWLGALGAPRQGGG